MGPGLFRSGLAGFSVLVGLTLLVLLLAAVLLQITGRDLTNLGLFLLLSGSITLGLGIAGMEVSRGAMLRTLQRKLLFVVLLATALALVNVGFTARLMFISSHDLGLLAVLLIFSLAMSAFFAHLLSQPFNQTMGSLVQAVRHMDAGQLDSRVPIRSRDEVGEVAGAFNAMAERLEAAFIKQRDLEQARRHLVASVSHDLRTPLASMRAMVESVNDGVVSDPETVQRYLHTLQAETVYLSRLIDDLFELSQIDAGLLEMHFERENLRDLISDTLQGLSAQAKDKEVTLKGIVDESLPFVVVDARRIQRVLYNLLQNALRFTPADGTIVIKAETTGSDVHVSVADTGEGISPEEMDRLFERFHRSDGARSRGQDGSGLGLIIARGIVEAHGGRIWADSIPGQGATFTFTLPHLAPPRPPHSPARTAPSLQP